MSRFDNVYIYDEFVNAGAVEWSDTANVLYSSDTTVSGQDVDLLEIAANVSGPELSSTLADVMDRGLGIRFSEGRIYSDFGRVIDTVTGSVVGLLTPSGPLAFARRLAVDAELRLAYMALRRFNDPPGSLRVHVFYPDSLAQIRAIQVPGSSASMNTPILEPRRIVRWGVDGLANLDSGGQVVLPHGPLVSTPGP